MIVWKSSFDVQFLSDYTSSYNGFHLTWVCYSAATIDDVQIMTGTSGIIELENIDAVFRKDQTSVPKFDPINNFSRRATYHFKARNLEICKH